MMNGDDLHSNLSGSIGDTIEDPQRCTDRLPNMDMEIDLEPAAGQHADQGVREHPSHRCLVQRLLNETFDGTECAELASLADNCANDEQCIKTIIAVVVKEVDQAATCYRLLKLNSLELFKAYLSSAGLDVSAMFQNVARAVIELRVRNVALSIELNLYVKWYLAEYGYRNLTGDWPDNDGPDSWKGHIGIICECWDDIVHHQHNANDHVDDRLLHCVCTIHNQLYFIQFKKFLEHLPIWETVFSLAIFMHIHESPTNYRFYRLMISKRVVIECLAALVWHLKHVREELEKIEPVLGEIMTSMQTVDAKLYEQMLDSLKTSKTIKNKAFYLSKYSNPQGCTTEEQAKEILKVLKKNDKPAYESIMKQMNVPARKVEQIAKIRSTLPCVVHPENVYNRMVPEMAKKTPIPTIVAKIVKDESFCFETERTWPYPGALESIRSCYTQMKQFYSLVKLHLHVSNVVREDPTDGERFLACVKRSLTAIGEAINNTRNTPNMPDTRVDAALQRMFMFQFKDGSIWHRNTYAHELSLNRLTVAETEVQQLCRLPQHMRLIGVMLELMLAAVAAVIRHSFYRRLLQCDTLETLRALLIYAGESDLLREVEADWYEDVVNFYNAACRLMVQERASDAGRMPQFADIERSLKEQCSIVQELEEMVAVEQLFDYESVRKSCFASEDLAAIKRLLSWKLNAYDPSDILDRICNTWDADVSNVSHVAWKCMPLLQLCPVLATTNLARLQKSLTSVERYDYSAKTRELVKQLEVKEVSVNDAGWKALNEQLASYYRNIFLLETKWNVLKDFCKARNIPWDGKRADRLRREDRVQLQELFDARRTTIRSLFAQCNIETVDDLVHKTLTIPSNVIAAMEYVQLELCEMLLAVEYFGDNYLALKHSLPMIQGKSYRNYLAHDGLSYDLVTYSGREKCVINAFVFATTSIKLFLDDGTSNKPTVPSLKFPSFQDTKLWFEQQQALLSAVESADAEGDEIFAKLKTGAEMRGKYYCSPAVRYQPAAKFHTLAELVEWAPNRANPSVLALLCRWFPNFPVDYNNEQRQLYYALARHDFEAVYGKIAIWQEFPEELLAWPSLPLECVEAYVSQKGLVYVLKALFDYGNEPIALEVIKRYEFALPAQTWNGLLQRAMLRTMPRCANVLLSKMCCHLLPETLELAIVVHWTDILCHDAAKPVLDDDENWDDLIVAAVTMSNYQAVEYFVHRGHLKRCCSAAVCYGGEAVLETLLKYYPAEDDQTFLSYLLYLGAAKGQWECVRFLLNEGVGSAADVFAEDCNVLLILVRFGRVDLIRCIKQFDHAKFCSISTEHPFAVASDHDTLSDEMIQALKACGFGYLDDPTVLHVAVGRGRKHPLWENVWYELAGRVSYRSQLPTAHCRQVMDVLSRWKMIAFVEKFYAAETTLSCAVEADNPQETVGKVLDTARGMRMLADSGSVLGDIAIGNGEMVGRFGSDDCEDKITDGCNAIMHKMKELHSAPDELWWQDFTLEVGTMVVKFTFLGAKIGNIVYLQLELNESNLIANLQSLRTATDELFGERSTVYGTLSTGSRSLDFFRIDEWCCAYELHPPGSVIDLSSVVNARLPKGSTILYKAIKYKCSLDTIKLLVENGANPLLADAENHTALAEAIAGTDDRSIALYLMEQCKTRGLHNEDGCSLELVTIGPVDTSLLELAKLCGHREAVDMLENLQRANLPQSS